MVSRAALRAGKTEATAERINTISSHRPKPIQVKCTAIGELKTARLTMSLSR